MSIFNELLSELDASTRDTVLRALRTPEAVAALDENEVFVFGSNADGRHGAGAAAAAHKLFGAVWGEGQGLHGHSYAIDTMSGATALSEEVHTFLGFARERNDYLFLLTPIGTGIAGFTHEDVAPLFADAPANVILPQSFVDVLRDS